MVARRKSYSVKNRKATADRFFSLWIRKRDKNKCQKCGQVKEKMDCNHVYGRRILALRYDPANAITMCSTCHFWWHENPLEAMRWYEQKFPKNAEYLIKKRQEQPVKLDYDEIIESYRRTSNE